MLNKWTDVSVRFPASSNIDLDSAFYPGESIFMSPCTLQNQTPLAVRLPEPASRKVLKRSRTARDLDGGDPENAQRKKRRLRLNLVTSRLSRPYATPATHISGGKGWRMGLLARQMAAGGKLLQKAAILNAIAIRRKTESTIHKSGSCIVNKSISYRLPLARLQNRH